MTDEYLPGGSDPELTPLEKIQFLERSALQKLMHPRPKPSKYIPYRAQVREYVQQQKRKLYVYKMMREALEVNK